MATRKFKQGLSQSKSLEKNPSTPEKEKIKARGRRRFLGAAGAAIATGAVGISSTSESSSTTAAGQGLGNLPMEQRRGRCLQVRQQAAIYQFNRQTRNQLSNFDDATYDRKIASFTKMLPHNALGEVDLNAYQKYMNAVATGNPVDFDAIPLGGTGKLVNPQSAYVYELEGADSHQLRVTPPPAFHTPEAAGEMVEVYWRALTRDIPYSNYGQDPMIVAAINDLKRFPTYADVTIENVFRGEYKGDRTGPFISQFLLQPYILGSTPVQQLYRVPIAGNDHMTSYQSWLDIQNGKPPQTSAAWDSTFRYIRNNRDLTEWVHRDYSYQGFLVAALILQSFGAAAIDSANPYRNSPTQAGFSTFGGPHVLDLIARVATQALHAAWYQKWIIHRRLRPEEFAGRIHNHILGAGQYPISDMLLNSPALTAVFNRFGTYLMPQAYAEGCPAHPAFTGGHATIAGACITVLKAFFNESFVIPNPVIASEDGTTLQRVTDVQLTVGGELNKLASNIAFGRDTAGIHYRSDEIQGMQLGEAVAISVLEDFNTTYNERFSGFSLTKLDGTQILINSGPGRSLRFTRPGGFLIQ
jgi:hypothetical protein